MKKIQIRFIVLFSIIILCMMFSMKTQANIVPNYSFDTDINGWHNNFGSSTHETEIVYNGTGSVNVISSYSETYKHWGLLASDPITVSPSTKYYFRVFGNCTTTAGKFSMSLQWYNDESVVGNEWPLDLPTPDGTWQEILFNYTSAATANNVVIKIGCQSDTIPIEAFFDDVYLDTMVPIPESSINAIELLILTFGAVMIGVVLRKRAK